MSARPEDVPGIGDDRSSPMKAYGVASYARYTDEQLREASELHRQQLDELARHGTRGSASLRASIERELGFMQEEVLRRARARHPSSHGRRDDRPLRSLAWPPS